MTDDAKLSKRLTILLGNKFYRPVGGPETIVLDTVRELQALGHAAVPFAMAHPDNADSEYSEYFVSNIDYNAAQGRGMGRLVKEAADIIYSAEARRKIESLISKTKPDIAHLHNIYHQLSPAILGALRKAHIPTILTLHDGKLLCANMLFLRHGEICERCAGRKFYHAVINKCVKDSYAGSLVCCIEGMLHRYLRMYERGVDLFITPSRFLKDKMVEHGRLSGDRIEVLPNYADTDLLLPDYRPGNYGLFVGRLEPLKGVATLLNACKHVPDFEIRLAGRGPMFDEGQRFAEAEGIRNISFLGFQTGEDLRRLFRESRFVVLPSECYENCPMAILEAFSAGKPVIASRVGGIPELIEHGVDGLLFEPKDAEELARCMRALVDDPEMASEMGKKARAKAEQRHSLPSYIGSLLAIYERVLNRS